MITKTWMMYIELRKEITERRGLAKQYERRTSIICAMICTLLKQDESIKVVTPAKDVKIVSKQRKSIQENIENLLMVWLRKKQLIEDIVTEASGEPFKASRSKFENFKTRTGIHSLVKYGDAVSADMKAADAYLLPEI